MDRQFWPAILTGEQDFVISCFIDYILFRPEPFKYIHFPPLKDVGLNVKANLDNESVTLSTRKPVKGIVLDVEGDQVEWSDQAIDLVPGDPQTIRAKGLKGREAKLKLRFLGDGSA